MVASRNFVPFPPSTSPLWEEPLAMMVVVATWACWPSLHTESWIPEIRLRGSGDHSASMLWRVREVGLVGVVLVVTHHVFYPVRPLSQTSALNPPLRGMGAVPDCILHWNNLSWPCGVLPSLCFCALLPFGILFQGVWLWIVQRLISFGPALCTEVIWRACRLWCGRLGFQHSFTYSITSLKVSENAHSLEHRYLLTFVPTSTF